MSISKAKGLKVFQDRMLRTVITSKREEAVVYGALQFGLFTIKNMIK
jgi:hypothetical protein